MSAYGFLIVNKPRSVTSRHVVNIAQRRLRPLKVGHAGTLDPLAEGVLLLAIGSASRLVPYVHQLNKRYDATFQFGVSSPSGDLEGPLVRHEGLPTPSLEQLQAAAESLTGSIEQTPPAHSAIRVDGRRAYQRVRAGEQVVVPKRTVLIESLKIMEFNHPDVQLDIVCGTGTYIRTLGMDLAKQVGSIAVMTGLCRTRIGPFRIEDAITLEQLQDAPLNSHLRPAVEGTLHMPLLRVNEADAALLGHGRSVQGETDPPVSDRPGAEAAAVDSAGRLRAIVRIKGGEWWPHRVFAREGESLG